MVRLPAAAQRRAVAAATEVLPTPPFPVYRMVRGGTRAEFKLVLSTGTVPGGRWYRDPAHAPTTDHAPHRPHRASRRDRPRRLRRRLLQRDRRRQPAPGEDLRPRPEGQERQ